MQGPCFPSRLDCRPPVTTRHATPHVCNASCDTCCYHCADVHRTPCRFERTKSSGSQWKAGIVYDFPAIALQSYDEHDERLTRATDLMTSCIGIERYSRRETSLWLVSAELRKLDILRTWHMSRPRSELTKPSGILVCSFNLGSSSVGPLVHTTHLTLHNVVANAVICMSL